MDRIERTASIRENLIEYYTQIDDIKTIPTFLDFASSGGSRQDPGIPSEPIPEGSRGNRARDWPFLPCATTLFSGQISRPIFSAQKKKFPVENHFFSGPKSKFLGPFDLVITSIMSEPSQQDLVPAEQESAPSVKKAPARPLSVTPTVLELLTTGISRFKDPVEFAIGDFKP